MVRPTLCVSSVRPLGVVISFVAMVIKVVMGCNRYGWLRLKLLVKIDLRLFLESRRKALMVPRMKLLFQISGAPLRCNFIAFKLGKSTQVVVA